MPLVFLPHSRSFFLWGQDAARIGALAERGHAHETELVVPSGRRRVGGAEVTLIDAVRTLASIRASDVSALPPSFASWTLASKLSLDLIVRERVVPAFTPSGDGYEARWAAALGADDVESASALAKSMPRSAHAVPIGRGKKHDVWAPEALLRAFFDAAADALLRAPHAPARQETEHARAHVRWETRWLAALSGEDARFVPQGFAERTLAADLARWCEPLVGPKHRPRACFRLELPAAARDPFLVRFLLQAPDDPSLLVSAAEIWKATSAKLGRLGRAFRDPDESLLEALGRAARLFPPLAESLAEAEPERLELDRAGAWEFMERGASALAEAGFGVIVPAELTVSGRRRLRMRMRIGDKSAKVAGVVAGAAGLGLEQLVAFRWEAAVGDETLSARELAALAKQKAPLVLHRGAWVAVDPGELAEIQRRIAEGQGRISVREALAAALVGEVKKNELTAEVRSQGAFAKALEQLAQHDRAKPAVPADLRAELRPYQKRGLAWLSTLGGLGLGACLADDMGLGKTVQLIAFLLAERAQARRDTRPALVVAPTSVVGNWEREIERFAPTLPVSRHYGAERAKSARELTEASGSLVLTTYGLLRRDAELLAGIDWSSVVLDEAQNIKNAFSATARAARSLKASHKLALTGTPVENRLAELWSILEFANPGLLGPLEKFRREVALPIERYGNDEAATRLRRIVSPFVLRRLKSDPSAIADLPAKNEIKVVCTLTREQATLYKAVVDAEMRRIKNASTGIERRGRVLALLGFLKQICNHPAQYLGESAPLARRSGKLSRLSEMLEEALASGDKALVFTQYREMGERLVSHLGATLGVEIAFLHGGTPRRAREEMVRRFQEDGLGPRVFVLSLKAGGTGLNLTAANHVFHYDRWWNPAVEDQATDRAYRIGQKRNVQVFKLVCAGTVEEKVERLLEQKRNLSSKIIAAGESFITELDDAALRELFVLSDDAAIASDAVDEEASS